MNSLSRRGFLKAAVIGAGTPALVRLLSRDALAQTGSNARRVIFFYFPDGVAESSWHATGDEHNFSLSYQQQPLDALKSECVFFRGLSMGPADAGSHPGGAKKLLTGVDGGNGQSIDHALARSNAAAAPHRHVFLGAMANHNNASGDKHISYPQAGSTMSPEDNPVRAFSRLFGGGGTSAMPESSRPADTTVIDAMLADFNAFSMRVGKSEQRKLALHLESLREVEKRIKSMPTMPPASSCQSPVAPNGIDENALYSPEQFPDILRAQIDVMVHAMECDLTRVGVIQASHHTSELIMSRFANTEMSSSRDMRSHEASHYGGSQDHLDAYIAQRRWFVSQFAYLLQSLADKPEDGGSMLDHSIVVLASEVCDGNNHLHDNMPFILGGRASGRINTGRLLSYDYMPHGNLWASVAQAMGENFNGYGNRSNGTLPGLLA